MTSYPGRLEGGLHTRRKYSKRPVTGNPLVSVITVVRNGEETLEQTIQSVLNQTYDNIEYIIIDGGSTDGTVDIIKQYEDAIAYWISEPDQGISDAFNKGISLATGDFITLLNADDWMSADQLERAADALQHTAADFVFGDLVFHDPDGNADHLIYGDPHYASTIRYRMPDLCHPTVVASRKAYEKYGLFETRYQYAMDYEWFLRLHAQGGRGAHVDGLMGHMRLAGASDASYLKALNEVRTISIRYGRSSIAANLAFLGRALKGLTRRLLEYWLPRPFTTALRRRINKSFAPYHSLDAHDKNRSHH